MDRKSIPKRHSVYLRYMYANARQSNVPKYCEFLAASSDGVSMRMATVSSALPDVPSISVTHGILLKPKNTSENKALLEYSDKPLKREDTGNSFAFQVKQSHAISVQPLEREHVKRARKTGVTKKTQTVASPPRQAVLVDQSCQTDPIDDSTLSSTKQSETLSEIRNIPVHRKRQLADLWMSIVRSESRLIGFNEPISSESLLNSGLRSSEVMSECMFAEVSDISHAPSENSYVPSEASEVLHTPLEVACEPSEVSDTSQAVPTEISDVPAEMLDIPSEMLDSPSELLDIPSDSGLSDSSYAPSEISDFPSEASDFPSEFTVIVGNDKLGDRELLGNASASRLTESDFYIETEHVTRMRSLVMSEIVRSEEVYVASLHELRDLYIEPLTEKFEASKKNPDKVFGTVTLIMQLHEQFISELRTAEHLGSIAPVICEYARFFRIYTHFVRSFRYVARKAVSALPSGSGSKDEKILLLSLLVRPVQRLPRYVLLLTELQKQTDKMHPEYPAIEGAIVRLQALCQWANMEFKSSKRAARRNGSMKKLRARVKRTAPKAKDDGAVRYTTNARVFRPTCDAFFRRVRLQIMDRSLIWMDKKKRVLGRLLLGSVHVNDKRCIWGVSGRSLELIDDLNDSSLIFEFPSPSEMETLQEFLE